MKKYAQIYIAVWVLVVILFGSSVVAVSSGNGTLRFMGTRVNLAQGSSYQLYKINDSLAFELQNGRISLVSYEKTSGLYALAGEYQHTPVDAPGSVFMVSADYQQEDYVYSANPMGRTTIVNVKTGEKVGQLVKADPLAADYKPVDARQLPEYRQKGLVFEEQYKLTLGKISEKYQRLYTYSEKLFVLEMAFMLIFFILALAGIPLFKSRARHSSGM
ncbi:MAG TPA: hypothetical protein VN611_05820 [Patescibacteria group bacterium]|nr:hypothetical protein [Patescibacteria group bacterium]